MHRDAYPDAEAGFTNLVLREPVKQGAYLVTLGHCMECHSSWQRGVSDYINGLGRRGRQFSPALVKGFASTWDGAKARNITSHKTAGIGTWTDAEIKRAITQPMVRGLSPQWTLPHMPKSPMPTLRQLLPISAQCHRLSEPEGTTTHLEPTKAVPASSVMNSRRFIPVIIRSPRRRARADCRKF